MLNQVEENYWKTENIDGTYKDNWEYIGVTVDDVYML